MSLFDNLAHGFGIALTLNNFLYCLGGATIGTLVGVLPGIGPLTTIAMLLPLTFKMTPVASLITLAGIYYGAHHAGSTTAIMLNMPGDPSSVVICMDGHPMARQGRAGPALCISAIGSFFAGCVGVVLIALFSPWLARVALNFAAPEYTSLVVVALLATTLLSRGTLLLNLGMGVLGLLLATVGTDVESGTLRFTFGAASLADGLSFVIVAVGVFAFAEVIANLGRPPTGPVAPARLRNLLPRMADLAASWKPILRGTALGSALGLLPGTGPMVSSFASYTLERQLAADRSRFGQGAIEGVAGPESANNAAAMTHFIPMLTLGIPAGAAMALMLGAMMIQGIAPGPRVMIEHPDVFWGLIASMWLGNLMLLVLNLPLVGVWVKLLSIPYRLLFPAIVVFCCIGVYSVNNAAFDVALAAGFGLFGYLLHKLACPPMPLVVSFILGPVLEQSLRRALLLSRGDPSVFVTRPISCGLLVMAVVLIAVYVLTQLRGRRRAELPVMVPRMNHEIPDWAPLCAAPDPHPRAPRLATPANACDCHAHICGPLGGLPYDDERIYTPPDALLPDYRAMLDTLGVRRAVLVQPSVYGTDNRVMLQALRAGGDSLRGVAVVSPDIGEAELQELHQTGVRGLRFNCVDRREGRNTVPVAEIAALAERIQPLGWHVEFLLQVDAAPDLSVCNDLPVDVVFGHLGYVHAERGGAADAGFNALLQLLEGGRCWVKLTGPYRISAGDLPYADVAAMARALVAAAPERLVWGSDWPHVMVRKAMPNDGALLDLLAEWVPDDAVRRRILVDNPARLYGFE